MAKDFEQMEDSNRSANADIHSVSSQARRQILQLSLGAAAQQFFRWSPVALAAGTTAACAQMQVKGSVVGFKGIPVTSADRVTVPEGYTAQLLAPWGEAIGVPGNMPDWQPDGSNSAAEQAVQMGMHHDGMHFYSFDGQDHGLLVMNHEYVDDGLLHTDGLKTWSAEKVRKSQAAHGISIIEIERKTDGGGWQMVRPSKWARRLTATTPFALSGPAAGHPLMRTADDPAGMTVLGTFNNCAAGKTPWGTYLSGEENFRFYFASNGAALSDHQKRWGLNKGAFYGWPAHDKRFDSSLHPNEFNRFGWVVEVDPMDPSATPVKRTAMGRAAHEGAWVAVTQDGRAVVYSGEDARFEYIYKFVSRDKIAPAGKGLTQAQANRHLLDHGTLYVARFDADGSGQWLPLVHGVGPLTPANGFADQGEVVIKARQASDALGGTKMDRPEWMAINPATREVFCTLTNNSARGGAGSPGVDAANPRANNTMGQIIRWQESGDFDANSMQWRHLVLAGDPANERAAAKGNVKGDVFGCPDGLMLDRRGVLWIQTDAHSSEMNKGEFKNIGNNQMLACDLATGEIRRFLTGPVNCEITGATLTPDACTLFINIQHPGESPSDRSDPDQPNKYSSWPQNQFGGAGSLGHRPRSATIVIRRQDGGVIGT